MDPADVDGGDVAARVDRAAAGLTRSERRVAEVIMTRPQDVAFGTVAELSEAAEAGAATVVRLAHKLGFDGFSDMQTAVRAELTRRLRPAAERIREPAADDLVGRHLVLETDNVTATLAAVGDENRRVAVSLLADTARPVLVLSGDASTGVVAQIAADLGSLRSGVELVTGNEVAVKRRVSTVQGHEVVLAVDVRRYDRWLVEAVAGVRRRGVQVVAITDSTLSPLCVDAASRFVVAAASTGPFDSHTGTLALGNLLVTDVAVALRDMAAARLDAAEAAWQESSSLTDG